MDLQDEVALVHPELSVGGQRLEADFHLGRRDGVSVHVGDVFQGNGFPVLIVVALQHDVQLRVAAEVVNDEHGPRLVFGRIELLAADVAGEAGYAPQRCGGFIGSEERFLHFQQVFVVEAQVAGRGPEKFFIFLGGIRHFSSKPIKSSLFSLIKASLTKS